MSKVVVGMSGGVDSSVAATLLKQQGYEVVGVTLELLPQECEPECPDSPCGSKAVEDARVVCEQLRIRHHAFNFRHVFEERIIDYFCSEYNAGRTPNPCVRCNKRVKFPMLLYAADTLDADFIATGHYARLYSNPDVSLLRMGKDESKDQSYFLFELEQATLHRTIFPVGEMTKGDSRRIAGELDLHLHRKRESQDICFIKDGKYDAFLKERMLEKLVPGPIYDTSGRQIGVHKGIQLYTIGQRRGTRIAWGKPLYVVSIDTETNSIIVGSDKELFADGLIADELSWVPGRNTEKPISAHVKIRYNHRGIDAKITRLDENRVEVIFAEPQRAVAPGQAAVFYEGDIVIGGGWITRPVRLNSRRDGP